MQTLPQIFAFIVVKYTERNSWVICCGVLQTVFVFIALIFVNNCCCLDFYSCISLQHFLRNFFQCMHALTLDLEHNAYHVQHAVFAASHVMSTVRVARAPLRCLIETVHVLKSQLGGACRWPAKGVRSLISLATSTAIGQRHLQLQLALTEFTYMNRILNMLPSTPLCASSGAALTSQMARSKQALPLKPY